jgi:predicted acylesterase/phospholipase RssA
MPESNMASPTLFRTWTPMKNASYNCTIVEVARATSAAPTFFKAISIGDEIKERFVDGGLRCNNPISHVLAEAESLFPKRMVACIVSLGTGKAEVIGMAAPDAFQKILPLNLIDVLKKIATDCEQDSERNAKLFTKFLNFYFRFNVEQGLQKVSLAEWEKLSDVKTHTDKYIEMHDVDKKVDQLVQVLQEQPCVLAAEHLSKL